MASKSLKIDKSLRPNTLWAYADGQTWDSIFNHPEANTQMGKEPESISNHCTVLRDSIIHEQKESRASVPRGRLEYQDTSVDKSHQAKTTGSSVKSDRKQIACSRGDAKQSKPARRLFKLGSDDIVKYLFNKSNLTQVLPEEDFFLRPK